MSSPRILLALFAVSGAAFGAGLPAPLPAPAQVSSPHAAPAPAPAAEMGRLFFTPAERAVLDESRRRPMVVVTAKPEVKSLPPAPGYVTLDGIVRRSDGTTSIWLNNKLVQGGRTSEGLEIADSKRAPGKVTVRVPQAGRSVELGVGQQLDVTSGKVQERYQAAPAAPAAAAPTERSAAEPVDTAAKPAARRPGKERDLLRDLLREIEGPPAQPAEAAAPAKG